MDTAGLMIRPGDIVRDMRTEFLVAGVVTGCDEERLDVYRIYAGEVVKNKSGMTEEWPIETTSLLRPHRYFPESFWPSVLAMAATVRAEKGIDPYHEHDYILNLKHQLKIDT